jgi:hypothetical protein
MLSRKLAQVGISAESPPASANSLQLSTACLVHWTLVCCRLNLATRTTTPQ